MLLVFYYWEVPLGPFFLFGLDITQNNKLMPWDQETGQTGLMPYGGCSNGPISIFQKRLEHRSDKR